ncbi:MAG: hypothetical protein GW942_02290 [Candidatus Pacebacteria bacterium]|nr:hypothetical protein [Candidatus Paceibacterota bacterium]
MTKNNKSIPPKKVTQPPHLPFGQGMVNITNIIGTNPDFKALTKPTQTKNGLRQFRDSKGTFFETDQSKPKKKIISE